ncbi:MAG: hypothetical protein WC479_08555 [Candidatus Izemoplasmatales bacterium]
MKLIEILPLPENPRLTTEGREGWFFANVEGAENIRVVFNMAKRDDEKAFVSFSEVEGDGWLEDIIDSVESYYNACCESEDEELHISSLSVMLDQQEVSDSELIEVCELRSVAGAGSKLSTGAFWAGLENLDPDSDSKYACLIFSMESGELKVYQLD